MFKILHKIKMVIGKWCEDREAVRLVRRAQSEPTIRGDLRELLKKF